MDEIRFVLIENDEKTNEFSEEEIIPSSSFLMYRNIDNKLIGSIKINHYLDETLLNNNGHIEISVYPEENNNDYFSEIINLALLKCKDLDIGRVLILCDKNDDLLKNAIIKNNGVLVDEINILNDTIKQRYRISLKKRYSNRHKQNKPNSDLIYEVKHFEEGKYSFDVSYYDFNNADIKIVTPKGKVIIDNNYKLLEFYDYNSKTKLSTFYDDNDEIIEWYFDIAKEIGMENGVPFEDDLYLDIVVRPDGTIKLLDENELKLAFDRFEITEEEYNMAYSEANKLISMLEGNEDKLKMFTDKYLAYFEKLCK